MNSIPDVFYPRDFQKLNSTSCGMGILARSRFKAGRMPTPQENFKYFFIWKSPIQILMLELRLDLMQYPAAYLDSE